MQRFINHPDDVVDDMLTGFLFAHREVRDSENHSRVLFHTAANTLPDKVGLVSGGGSGHEPAFLGYLGSGLLDAVAVGEVFSSPTAGAFLQAIHHADRGQGVACLFGNYAGDSMNVQMAVNLAQEEARNVVIVKARDDIASAPKAEMEKRHGIAGGVFMWKCAGSVAAQGGSLDEVAAAARVAAENTRSICVGLSPCTIPAVGSPNFSIAPGTCEYGIGHHGEPGRGATPLANASHTANTLVEALLGDYGDERPQTFAVMVSGLGSTPLMEQYIMHGHIVQALTGAGHRVWRSYVGNYVTSLEMNGICLTLLRLDEATKGHLSYPACPAGLASL